ncbi:Uu.00g115390.m01.CDS01 [Anthostomella pinea]|uniref:Uu.00g115390.m01.CDS01 n=1 Tax=Anthostomella pinea TaxID=933095 RepID=A0AAI8VFV7_9PEZI|nr:Uu.00g115390.m01.CDS01 [Anthostomella pinea]
MRLDPTHTIISTTDTGLHDDLRARLSAAYTGRELPSMEHHVDVQIYALKDLIRRKYISTTQQTRPLDWASSRNADPSNYIRLIESAGMFFGVCSDVPRLGKLLEVFRQRFGPKKTDKSDAGSLLAYLTTVAPAHKLAGRIVNERAAPEAEEKGDMLASFMQRGLSNKQCEAEFLTQLVAGSDTTANFLLRRCGKISTPVTGAEGKALPYLQAFIWECFRFQPPLFMLFPKVMPPEGDVLAGQKVPGGTNIGIDSWSMARREEIFGKDADVFRPVRFLEASPEHRLLMERTAELVFGSGRWVCIGKVIAHLELNKIYVELLRDFDFQVMDLEKPYTISHRSMFFIRDVWLRVTERDNSKTE